MQQHKEWFKYLMNTITRFRPTSDVGQGCRFLRALLITCNGLSIWPWRVRYQTLESGNTEGGSP